MTGQLHQPPHPYAWLRLDGAWETAIVRAWRHQGDGSWTCLLTLTRRVHGADEWAWFVYDPGAIRWRDPYDPTPPDD